MIWCMPAVVKVLDEAARRESAIRRTVGDERRQARLVAGVSRRGVSEALGCSSATISRVERGLVRNLTLRHVTRHAVVVGLALRADLFPAGAPIRDAGQLKVLARLQRHVADPFRWVLEMPVGRGDLRAFDAGAIRPGCRVAFEAWSRVRDARRRRVPAIESSSTQVSIGWSWYSATPGRTAPPFERRARRSAAHSRSRAGRCSPPSGPAATPAATGSSSSESAWPHRRLARAAATRKSTRTRGPDWSLPGAARKRAGFLRSTSSRTRHPMQVTCGAPVS